jgi:hypothetical protein
MKTRLIGLLVAVLVLGTASTSVATGWGVGGFAGVSIPVAQDDAANGTVFGGRLKLSLGGLLGLEPNFTYAQDGDWNVDEVEETFKGAKFTSVGVNLLFGGSGPVTALRFFSFVGAKYYSEDNDLRETDSRLGWNGGVGIEFGAGNIGFEGRGGLELMTLDGGGSRKWGHITGGVNLYFGAP